jgi:hypothetical protein
MPPLSQRRNTAYLNRLISRFGPQDRGLYDQVARSFPDLRLISGARSNDVSDPLTWPVCACGCVEVWAPRVRRASSTRANLLEMICAF